MARAVRRPSRARSRHGTRSLPARLWRWLWVGALGFVLVSLAWVGLYAFVPPPITATMIADRATGRSLQREWMPLEQIDPDMARAVIAAEDSKFCSHDGFDYEAIGAAYIEAKTGGRRRGASTVSQQTAKNAFLWQGGGYVRKGLEAWFTLLIETFWTKRRIMEVYLNVAETGIGTYGVNAGALRYFDHDASRLSAAEAARIAAVLPLPKKRAAADPRGWTRRYGRIISARMGVVKRDGLDACLALGAGRSDEPVRKTPPRTRGIEDALDKAGRLPTIPAIELEPEPAPDLIAAEPEVVAEPTPEPAPVEEPVAEEPVASEPEPEADAPAEPEPPAP